MRDVDAIVRQYSSELDGVGKYDAPVEISIVRWYRSVTEHYDVELASFFFFSSRRRHTRLQGDWSSDVCSSDLLSRSLRDAAGPAEPETRSVTGGRAVANLIMQVVARAERRAEGVLSAELLRPTLPAWRRAKDRATLELRAAGDVPAEASPIFSGTVSGDLPTVLLIDDGQTVIVTGSGETAAGMWSSHPAVAALARAWIRGLA